MIQGSKVQPMPAVPDELLQLILLIVNRKTHPADRFDDLALLDSSEANLRAAGMLGGATQHIWKRMFVTQHIWECSRQFSMRTAQHRGQCC